MKWERISGRTGYFDTPLAIVPTYHLSENEIVMIDSGVKPDPELLDELKRLNLRVRAVLCTHLHPDHIANNPSLVEQYGTEIFSTQAERESHEHWEKLPYDITFLDGKTSVVIDETEFAILPTQGHSAGHLAYVTPDGVCCVGDVLMTAPVLRWSKMPYMDDVDGCIVSMERLRDTKFPFYAIAHKGVVPFEEMPALVDENIQKELDLYDLLRRQIAEPKRREDVLRDFMLAAGIQERNLNTFFIRYTAKMRLEALIDAGEYYLRDGMVIPCHKH